MRDHPSGTVTFLFTDVEGSTKLLHSLGAEAYAEALAPHPRAVRGACAAEGGGEVAAAAPRAARIAAAGYGGQVLVSASTAQLVELELTDLGEHRLKDLSAAERIFQFGDGAFPRLKSP